MTDPPWGSRKCGLGFPLPTVPKGVGQQWYGATAGSPSLASLLRYYYPTSALLFQCKRGVVKSFYFDTGECFLVHFGVESNTAALMKWKGW